VIKQALYLHIRILWFLLEKNAIPSTPSATELALFHSRFASEDDVLNARTSERNLIDSTAVHIARATLVKNPSRHIADARRVEEFALEYLSTFCARYGLARWVPDLRDTAYSLYNSAHRIVALDSFRQLCTMGVYDFFGLDYEHISDLSSLV
jgi:hypothetical protein